MTQQVIPLLYARDSPRGGVGFHQSHCLSLLKHHRPLFSSLFRPCDHHDERPSLYLDPTHRHHSPAPLAIDHLHGVSALELREVSGSFISPENVAVYRTRIHPELPSRNVFGGDGFAVDEEKETRHAPHEHSFANVEG